MAAVPSVKSLPMIEHKDAVEKHGLREVHVVVGGEHYTIEVSPNPARYRVSSWNELGPKPKYSEHTEVAFTIPVEIDDRIYYAMGMEAGRKLPVSKMTYPSSPNYPFNMSSKVITTAYAGLDVTSAGGATEQLLLRPNYITPSMLKDNPGIALELSEKGSVDAPDGTKKYKGSLSREGLESQLRSAKAASGTDVARSEVKKVWESKDAERSAPAPVKEAKPPARPKSVDVPPEPEPELPPIDPAKVKEMAKGAAAAVAALMAGLAPAVVPEQMGPVLPPDQARKPDSVKPFPTTEPAAPEAPPVERSIWQKIGDFIMTVVNSLLTAFGFKPFETSAPVVQGGAAAAGRSTIRQGGAVAPLQDVSPEPPAAPVLEGVSGNYRMVQKTPLRKGGSAAVEVYEGDKLVGTLKMERGDGRATVTEFTPTGGAARDVRDIGLNYEFIAVDDKGALTKLPSLHAVNEIVHGKMAEVVTKDRRYQQFVPPGKTGIHISLKSKTGEQVGSVLIGTKEGEGYRVDSYASIPGKTHAFVGGKSFFLPLDKHGNIDISSEALNQFVPAKRKPQPAPERGPEEFSYVSMKQLEPNYFEKLKKDWKLPQTSRSEDYLQIAVKDRADKDIMVIAKKSELTGTQHLDIVGYVQRTSGKEWAYRRLNDVERDKVNGHSPVIGSNLTEAEKKGFIETRLQKPLAEVVKIAKTHNHRLFAQAETTPDALAALVEKQASLPWQDEKSAAFPAMPVVPHQVTLGEKEQPVRL